VVSLERSAVASNPSLTTFDEPPIAREASAARLACRQASPYGTVGVGRIAGLASAVRLDT
jgi:hypothetical protein